MADYRYSADQTVLEQFGQADEAERSRLLAAFARLAAQPEQACDFEERSASGRELRGKWFGDWLLRYWIDHPVKTVVIVDLRWT